ncbi:hypothetical protein ABZ958_31575 [Streptomyces sp. NPDC046237]|uniref:hypothetical protein n=1 Tax=Streptomyces sp. NPDC046237 TaxID=3154914 RepID=UPI00340D76D0
MPARMAEPGAFGRRLNEAWGTVFDAYGDAEAALLIAHMRRTVELSAVQVERLRTGELDRPSGRPLAVSARPRRRTPVGRR